MFWGAGLTLKRRGAHRMVLSPPLALRALLAVFLAAVFVSMLSEQGHPRPVAAPTVLAVVLGIALLYNDSWVFDRQRGTAEGRLGLLILYHKRRVALSSLTEVRVVTAGRMARLEALDSSGKCILLDSSRAVRVEGLRRTGRRVAEFCGLPFSQ